MTTLIRFTFIFNVFSCDKYFMKHSETISVYAARKFFCDYLRSDRLVSVVN